MRIMKADTLESPSPFPYSHQKPHSPGSFPFPMAAESLLRKAPLPHLTHLDGALYKCMGRAWRPRGWARRSGARLLEGARHGSVRDAAA